MKILLPSIDKNTASIYTIIKYFIVLFLPNLSGKGKNMIPSPNPKKYDEII
jgi:hypothetical protein